MNQFIGNDDDAPPAKRLKLDQQLINVEQVDVNNNVENVDGTLRATSANSDVRKRKIAVKRTVEKTILDLYPDVILEIFEHLPLKDLCNVAQTNTHLAGPACLAFKNRYSNGFRMRTNGRDDIMLLINVLNTFGTIITAAGFTTNHGH